MQIRQNPKEEVGFPVFAILWKKFLTRSGRGHRKVIQLHSGNLRTQGFWMCSIVFGSYMQKCVFLGCSTPCKRRYVYFCVWDIRRSLDQPSKLHCPPLHGLACSTTFSWRKIKIIKAASSNERVLAVHARLGMLPWMYAAIGASSSNTFGWGSRCFIIWWPAIVCEIMCAEVRKTVWTASWFPGKNWVDGPPLELAEENMHTRHDAMKKFQEEAESIILQ